MTINKMSDIDSISIRYLRAIAIILIVACHFVQTLGSHWAFVLNVVVEVFFVISGFLFGYKQVNDWGGNLS